MARFWQKMSEGAIKDAAYQTVKREDLAKRNKLKGKQ
jgi:hypothetical protein